MVFRFPVKFEIPKHVYVNGRVLKDAFKRTQVAEYEVTRNALRYIARNTTLPPKARLEAQLQLASMPKYTAPTQVKDRCIASGNSKWVISDFKLNRTEFRNRARRGQIPGVAIGSCQCITSECSETLDSRLSTLTHGLCPLENLTNFIMTDRP
ncbi:hypothetical protein CA7LBN_003518 [Candidozyma auris]|uniref:37S ribosomal protein MRP2, mitochondrial n=1 Tax=Candidozyma auris TaxID=498019 RepID=A0A8F2W5W3_CANAR|nr:hypothetical protein CA7LBN_003518 [[Candida] auris]